MGPDLLRDAKSALEKPMQVRTSRAGFAGRGVSLFRLAKDFGLTDHHRIKPRGDAEKMLHAAERFVAIKNVHFLLHRLHAVGQQTMRDPFGRNSWLRGSINFHPVAGGEEQRLRATSLFAQDAIDRRVPGETFARLNVRSVMADAYAEKVH